MAQLKSSPGDGATAREITDYLAYLRQQLQYEIDMREMLTKSVSKLGDSIAEINSQIAEILEILDELSQ